MGEIEGPRAQPALTPSCTRAPRCLGRGLALKQLVRTREPRLGGACALGALKPPQAPGLSVALAVSALTQPMYSSVTSIFPF